jgi:hypothetical protein
MVWPTQGYTTQARVTGAIQLQEGCNNHQHRKPSMAHPSIVGTQACWTHMHTLCRRVAVQPQRVIDRGAAEWIGAGRLLRLRRAFRLPPGWERARVVYAESTPEAAVSNVQRTPRHSLQTRYIGSPPLPPLPTQLQPLLHCAINIHCRVGCLQHAVTCRASNPIPAWPGLAWPGPHGTYREASSAYFRSASCCSSSCRRRCRSRSSAPGGIVSIERPQTLG